MVKALHRAGIEVILDVVFNHSAEGDDKGPTISFRGLDNRAYYILDGYRRYANFTGCGNTLKANHPVVRRLILDALRHWVSEMHVDGFRFDLASVLSRDTDGTPAAERARRSGTSRATRCWPARSSSPRPGTPPASTRWATSWATPGRSGTASSATTCARSCAATRGGSSHFANRLLASPDLYEQKQREPEQSVNFVTCHDGFTLNDLVTYEVKHNEANGERNRDGSNHELSWNCGVEGPSDDPAVEQLRNRQVKNFLAVNLLSAGVPMILMGDEMRRTQRGNNNAWCQDNETSWLDWSLRKTHADVHRFLRRLIRLRSSMHPDPRRSGTLTQFLRQRPHRVARGEARRARLERPGRSLAATFQEPDGPALAHVMVNAWNEPLEFELPPRRGAGGTSWWTPSCPPPTTSGPGRRRRCWRPAATSSTPHSFVFMAALAPERAGTGAG